MPFDEFPSLLLLEGYVAMLLPDRQFTGYLAQFLLAVIALVEFDVAQPLGDLEVLLVDGSEGAFFLVIGRCHSTLRNIRVSLLKQRVGAAKAMIGRLQRPLSLEGIVPRRFLPQSLVRRCSVRPSLR